MKLCLPLCHDSRWKWGVWLILWWSGVQTSFEAKTRNTNGAIGCTVLSTGGRMSPSLSWSKGQVSVWEVVSVSWVLSTEREGGRDNSDCWDCVIPTTIPTVEKVWKRERNSWIVTLNDKHQSAQGAYARLSVFTALGALLTLGPCRHPHYFHRAALALHYSIARWAWSMHWISGPSSSSTPTPLCPWVIMTLLLQNSNQTFIQDWLI